MPDRVDPCELGDETPEAPFELWVTLDFPDVSFQFEWIRTLSGIPEAEMRVRLTANGELSWEWVGSMHPAWKCRPSAPAVRDSLKRLRTIYPTGTHGVLVGCYPVLRPGEEPGTDRYQPMELPDRRSPWSWLEEEILAMARELGRLVSQQGPLEEADPERYLRRQVRKVERAAQEAAERQTRIELARQRQAAERRRKEVERRQRAGRFRLWRCTSSSRR